MCTCDLNLDCRNNTFLTGQQISGVGRITAQRRIFARDVFVQISGNASVKWISVFDGQELTGFHNFFDLTFKKLKQEHLPAGVTPFNFSVQLPWQLPASISRTHGNISYRIKFGVRIVSNAGGGSEVVNEIIANEKITVLKSLNLKLLPELISPIQKTAVRYFKFGIIKTGPFYVKIELDHNGYKSGDDIKYKIRITNYSIATAIRELLVYLEVEQLFIANECWDRPSKYDRKIVKRKTNSLTVKPHHTENFSGSIEIPPNSEASHGQGIVRTSYKLFFEFRGCPGNKHSHIYLPLTIGSDTILSEVKEPEMPAKDLHKVSFRIKKN